MQFVPIYSIFFSLTYSTVENLFFFVILLVSFQILTILTDEFQILQELSGSGNFFLQRAESVFVFGGISSIVDLCGGTHFLNYVDDISIWHHLWSTLAKHLKQDDYNRLFCNKKQEQDEALDTSTTDDSGWYLLPSSTGWGWGLEVP